MTYYPWNESFRERITHQFEHNKLAHAMLFAGPEYLGKFDLAFALSTQFLCTAVVSAESCGACSSCLLIRAGTHPDLRLVQPEDSKQIKIDQIRTLIRWVGQTSSRSGLKIAIVSPAEQMNHQSANALLKCLEEPASNTLIFLVTANPGSLLPTIRSRCQQYLFPIPNREVALRWLKDQAADLENPSMKLEISGGAPLAVLHQFDKEYFQRRTQITAAIRQVLGAAGNPVESASMVQKHEADDVLQTIISILSDCLKYKLSSDERFIKNQDVMAEVVSIADACSAGFLFAALDRVRADLKIAKSTSNPNKALLLESLMIDLFGKHKGSLVEYNL